MKRETETLLTEKRLWRHLKLVASLPERDQRAVLRIIDSTAKARRGA
jgi:hypothetical protein